MLLRTQLKSTQSLTSCLLRTFSTVKLNMNHMKLLREKTGAPIGECKDALTQAMTSVTSGVEQEILDFATDFLRKKGIATASKKAGRAATEGLVGLIVSSDNKAAATVELNSETDFASRSSQFQNLVGTVTQVVLNQSTSSQDLDMEVVRALPVTKLNVADTILEAVTAIRENLQLRRAAKLSVQNGVIGFYMHNAAEAQEGQPEGFKVGRTACLVALESTAEDKDALQDIGNKIAMHIVAAQPKFLNKESVPESVLQHEKDILIEQAKTTGKAGQFMDKIVQGRLNKFYEDFVLLEQKYMITEDNKPPKISQLLKDVSKELGAPVSITGYVRYAVGEGLQQAQKQSFADEVQSKLSGN